MAKCCQCVFVAVNSFDFMDGDVFKTVTGLREEPPASCTVSMLHWSPEFMSLLGAKRLAFSSHTQVTLVGVCRMATVCLTFDFDAICVWLIPSPGIGAVNMGDISRGEFGGRVGAPRVLDLLKKHDITTTWFVPGHTVDTFPDLCKRISEEGHEMGYHGYAHESDAAAEKEETLGMAMSAIRRVSGKNPVGCRYPGPFTNTLVDKLIEKGFVYDSSLQADDYHPYRVRKGDTWSLNGPYKFGGETKLVEIPFQWYLDDWPAFTFNWEPYTYGCTSVETMYQQYKRQFDYMHTHVKDGMIDYCFHPSYRKRIPDLNAR